MPQDPLKIFRDIYDEEKPVNQISRVAQERGATVTSTTGGRHNRGSRHYSGNAADIRTRDQAPEQVEALKQGFAAKGYRVLDERQRPRGQKVWSGPHLHVEEDDLTPFRAVAQELEQPAKRLPRPSYSGLRETVATEDAQLPPTTKPLGPRINAMPREQTDIRRPFTKQVNALQRSPLDTLQQDMARRDVMLPPAARTTPSPRPVSTEPPPTGVREAFNQFASGAAKITANMPQGLAELSDLAGRYNPLTMAGNAIQEGITGEPVPKTATTLRPYTQAAESAIDRTLPVDPNDKSWLTAKIPRAAGSVVPFLVGGLASGGSRVATALLGAAGNTADIASEFDQAGGDPAKRDQAIALAAATGLTEVFGVGKFLAKFGANGGMLQTAKTVLEEGGQEALQQWLNNVNAAEVGAYDPNRPQSQGVGESAALGGIIGGGVGAASGLAGRYSAPKATPEEIQNIQANLAARQAQRPPQASTAPSVSRGTVAPPLVTKPQSTDPLMNALDKYDPPVVPPTEQAEVTAPKSRKQKTENEPTFEPIPDLPITDMPTFAGRRPVQPPSERLVQPGDVETATRRDYAPIELDAQGRAITAAPKPEPIKPPTALERGRVAREQERQTFTGAIPDELQTINDRKAIADRQGDLPTLLSEHDAEIKLLKKWQAVATTPGEIAHVTRALARSQSGRGRVNADLKRQQKAGNAPTAGLPVQRGRQSASEPLLGAQENAEGGIPARPEAPPVNFERLASREADRGVTPEENQGNQSLESFIVRNGGVKRSPNNRGDVAYNVGREGGRPGVVNDRSGTPVDVMRQQANEAGFGPYETEADFLSAMRYARNVFSDARRNTDRLASEEDAYYANKSEPLSGLLPVMSDNEARVSDLTSQIQILESDIAKMQARGNARRVAELTPILDQTKQRLAEVQGTSDLVGTPRDSEPLPSEPLADESRSAAFTDEEIDRFTQMADEQPRGNVLPFNGIRRPAAPESPRRPLRLPGPADKSIAFPREQRSLVGRGREIEQMRATGTEGSGGYGQFASQAFHSTVPGGRKGQTSFYESPNVKAAVGLNADASQAEVRQAFKKELANLMPQTRGTEVSLADVPQSVWDVWVRRNRSRLGDEDVRRYKQTIKNAQSIEVTKEQNARIQRQDTEGSEQSAGGVRADESAAVSGSRGSERAGTGNDQPGTVRPVAARADAKDGEVSPGQQSDAEPRSLASQRRAPGFYSQLERVIDQKLPNNASPQQILAVLRNPQNSVKQDELDWLGVESFVEGKRAVSKADLQEFVRSNQVEVQEVEKGAKSPFRPQTADDVRKVESDDSNWYVLFDNGSQIDVRKFDADTRPEAIRQAVIEHNEDLEGNRNYTRNGDTKFSQYTLPGAKAGSYRELLLTLPDRRPAVDFQSFTSWAEDNFALSEAEARDSWDRQGPAAQDYIRARDRYHTQNFKSPHFDETNVLAHVRFNEREDVNGKRVLFIEEIQSDWHQKGRKAGYKDAKPSDIVEWRQVKYPNKTLWQGISKEGYLLASGKTKEEAIGSYLWNANDIREDAVPNAPFKKSWHELAFKRALRYAVENDFERVAWTTGEQQADRYDLSKQVQAVNWYEGDKLNSYNLFYTDKSEGQEHLLALAVPADKLEDHIGKDLARKIVEASEHESEGAFEGGDLKVGGEGMKGFYDKILPAFVSKYVKKWGAKVGTTGLSNVGAITDISIVRDARVNAAPNTWVAFDSKKEEVVGGPFPTHMGAMFWRDQQDRLPVHSLDITPAMRDSVSQGQPLFNQRQAGKPSANYWDTPAVTQIAQTYEEKRDQIVAHVRGELRTRKGRQGTLYTNEQGGIAVASALRSIGADPQLAQLGGVEIDLSDAQQVADHLRSNVGRYREQGRRLDHLASVVEASIADAQVNGARSITIADTTQASLRAVKETVREEATHAWQRSTGLLRFGELQRVHNFFKDNPTYVKMRDGILKHGYADEADTLAAEIPAKLASGAGAEFGLTENERAEFLHRYFRWVARNIGHEALRRDFTAAPVARKALEDVREIEGIPGRGRRLDGDARPDATTARTGEVGESSPSLARRQGSGRGAGSAEAAERGAQASERRGERGAVVNPVAKRTREDVEQSPEFLRWFGKSAVVDEQGKPAVMYHGTRGDFDTFELSSANPDAYVGRGIYLTTDPDSASTYAYAAGSHDVGSVMPLYLSAKRPFDVDGSSLKRTEIARLPQDVRELLDTQGHASYDDLISATGSADAANQALRALGYDAVTYIVPGDKNFESPDQTVWVAFEPSQVKSVTGNVGTYSKRNPDVRYSGVSPHAFRQLDDAIAKLAGQTSTKVPVPGTFTPQKFVQEVRAAIADRDLTPMQRTEMADIVNKVGAAEAAGDGAELVRQQRAMADLLTKHTWLADPFRPLMAAGEWSFIGLQGAQQIISNLGNPRALKDMGRTLLKSSTRLGFDNLVAEMRNHPRSEEALKAGLALSSQRELKIMRSGYEREEAFHSRIADLLPGLPMTNRQMTGFLDSQRLQAYDGLASMLNAQGHTYGDQSLTALERAKINKKFEFAAEMANTLTGRGDFGKFLENNPAIGSVLGFGPRWVASRFQLMNPNFYVRAYKADPQLAKQAGKEALKLYAAWGSVLAAGAVAGFDVSLDPDDSDFLKLKRGNYRLDVSLGMRPQFRIIAQMVKRMAELKDKPTDEVIKKAFQNVAHYGRTKLSPLASLAPDFYFGQNMIGEKVTPKEAIKDRVVPIFWKGVYEAYEEGGAGKAARQLPNAIGLQGSEYERKSARPAPSSRITSPRLPATRPRSTPVPVRRAR